METAAWLVEHPGNRRTARCGSASPATKRSATAWIISTWRRSARRSCYTLDGHGSGEIDVETFSADQAVVTVHGVNIHPSIAKGRMTNAVRVAADFIARLPRDDLSPETTDGREGFLHPYDIAGGVGEMKIKILLRDFDAAQLAELADRLRQIGRRHDAGVSRRRRSTCPSSGNTATWPKGWRASRGPWPTPKRPCERLGRTAKRTIVRGGTDGSRLTELGLPTPNLSCGGHNPHSPLEWACLEEMVESVEWLVSLAEVWGKDEG